MVILRYKASKTNGMPCGEYWYVAREYADGSFTITLNRQRAHEFTQTDADSFNQRQLVLGHITQPFESQKL